MTLNGVMTVILLFHRTRVRYRISAFAALANLGYISDIIIIIIKFTSVSKSRAYF